MDLTGLLLRVKEGGDGRGGKGGKGMGGDWGRKGKGRKGECCGVQKFLKIDPVYNYTQPALIFLTS